MTPERRAAVFLGLIFTSGVFLGGTAMNLAEHFWLHPRTDVEYDLRQHAQVADQMRSRLHLTPQQTAQVDLALQRAVRSYEALELRMAPEFDQIRQQGRNDVRTVLNDQQRQAFDQLVRQVDLQYPAAAQPAVLPDPCHVLAAPANVH